MIGVLRESADGDDAGAPAADARRPAGADRRVARGRHAGPLRLAARRTAAPVPAGAGRNAYRIVQEGLTNARKHARGAAVDVTVDGAPGDGLTIEIRNRLPVGALRRGGRSRARAPASSASPSGRAWPAGGSSTAARTPGDYRLWAWLPWAA